MDLQDIRERKKLVEKEIAKILSTFQTETDTTVTSVQVKVLCHSTSTGENFQVVTDVNVEIRL